MDRVTGSALKAGCLGVALLAVATAIDGYLHGAGANRQHPAGYDGAVINVMIATVFLGWTAFGIGAAAGAGAALASSLGGRLCRCWRPPA